MYKSGVDITVIIRPGTFNYEPLIKAGVPTIPYVITRRISPQAIRFIRKNSSAKPYDVLHMLDKRGTINGLFASIGMNIKLIAYRGIVGNLSYWDPLAWLYLLNPRLDRIICVCEAITDNTSSVLACAGIRLRRDVPVTIHKGHNPELVCRSDRGYANNSEFRMVHSWLSVLPEACHEKGFQCCWKQSSQLPPGSEHSSSYWRAPGWINRSIENWLQQIHYAENIHLFRLS